MPSILERQQAAMAAIIGVEHVPEGHKFATINEADDLEGVDDGGSLNPRQRKEFYNRVVDEFQLKNHCQIIPMTGNGEEIAQLDITGRVTERDSNQTSRKRGVDTSDVVLNGKRIKTAFKVTRGFLETNVAGESALDDLVNAFATKMGNDIEQLLWFGNVVGPAKLQSDFNNDRDDVGSTTQYVLDTLWNLFDGMIRQAITGGTVVNGSYSADIKRLITQALKSMPGKYDQFGQREQLRLFMPRSLVLNLINALSERRTGLGDMLVIDDPRSGGKTLYIMGIPCVPFSLLETYPTYVEHVTLSGTTSTPTALSFSNIDQDDVIVTPSTLSTSAVTPYILGTDYAIGESTGNIGRIGGGGISNNQVVKVTYKTPPLFILTPKNNVLVGLNEDFRVGEFEDVDLDTMLTVIRTRVDCKYNNPQEVVIVKNIQDALATTAFL